MKKEDFTFNQLFKQKDKSTSSTSMQSFSDYKWLDNSIITSNSKWSFWEKLYYSIRKILYTPEFRVILILLLSRIFFVIFTHWGMDFDWYLEIVQRVFAGEKLFVDFDSTHMPLVDLIYILMYTICPYKGNIFAVRIFMKLPFILADIGIALITMKIIENEFIHSLDKNPPLLGEDVSIKVNKVKFTSGLFIALSLPLIFQSAGGRYDSLMIFCFSMIIFCLQKNNWFGIAFYAALGTSTKYIGIIFLPFVILWLKRKDILPFIFGLSLGFLPLIPFLITTPHEFIAAIFNRSSHIAYGFSFWHGLYILLSGFKMKSVGGISDTYDSSTEPWFIQKLYIPMFIIIYLIIFTLYINKYYKEIQSKTITELPLNILLNMVFIPLFIFAISFKAINIQVLAWFAPYIALKKKRGILLEYSCLTVLHGLALILFEAYNSQFLEIAQLSAPENSLFWFLVIKPVIKLTEHVPQIFWIILIFISICWFFIRTTHEFINSSKELLKVEN